MPRNFSFARGPHELAEGGGTARTHTDLQRSFYSLRRRRRQVEGASAGEPDNPDGIVASRCGRCTVWSVRRRRCLVGHGRNRHLYLEHCQRQFASGFSVGSHVRHHFWHPTTLGNYVFTVQVTDQASLSYRQQLSIYVQGVVSITPAVLPSGAANVAYPPVQLVATGGLPPYVWCVVESSGTCDQGNGGALPPGLSLSSDG